GGLEGGDGAAVGAADEQGGVVHGHLGGAASGEGAFGDEGLQRRRHRGQLVPGDELGGVHDVGADAAGRAGPGLVPDGPPGEGGLRVGQPVLEVLGADVPDGPDPPVGDAPAGEGDRGGAAVVEPD